MGVTDYVVVKADDCNGAVDVMDEVIVILKTVECGQDVWERVFAVRRWLENGGCTFGDMVNRIIDNGNEVGVRLYGV